MQENTAEQLIKLNQDLYNKVAEDFSNTRKEIWEQEIIDFVKNIQRNSTVLDLGCGNARLYQILSNKSINYLGIDSSNSLINLDKKNYPEAKFKVGDGLKIKYKNKFDYIISIAVLHHVPSEELQIKFLTNCKKALKKDGILFLSVWNRWQAKYKKYFLDKKTFDDMNKADILVPWKGGKSRFVHAFKINELKTLAKKAGFKKTVCFASAKGKQTDLNKALNIYLIASPSSSSATTKTASGATHAASSA